MRDAFGDPGYTQVYADRGFNSVPSATAIADLMLQPRNPFDPKAPRQPKKDFVLLVLFGALGVGAFVYFNLLGWK